jgi:glycosyltransferase involved in cell wall biosynthesis/MoaA/NifB/PqqE/SkfB family radical SAM enzyme
MSEGKRLFCSKPFKWFEVSQGIGTGEVYVCCPAWLDLSIGNLTQQPVEEIWNGKQAQEIRRSILDGSFKYCDHSRCAFLQTLSGPVQYVEDVTDEDLKMVVANDLTVLPYGPREINCSYDRSCNLSCPSCRTQIIVESRNKEQILSIQNKISEQALKDAHYLSITGSGDPFGSPFFRRWLQSMNRADMPGLKGIHLHTNGLLWTPPMWNTIAPDVRQLITSAEISIDAATAETYKINRRGGSFEKLLENLEFISKLRRDGPLEWVGISMVVQENNFEEMPEFVRLAKRFNLDTAYFSRLVNWGTYSEEEYNRRAIHSPKHPRHEDLIDVLRREEFDQSVVNLGNLTEFRPSDLKISAIICTHNRAPYLVKAIESLLDQTLSRDSYEIIVVDNRSTDGTGEAVKRFLNEKNVRYVYEPALGLSHARNAGWRNAKGRYVAYLDDDAIASSGWLERIVEVFENVKPTPGCVGGRIFPIWEAERPEWLSDELVTGLTVIDWSERPHVLEDISREWLAGANLAFPASLLKRTGGFVAGLDRAGSHLLSGGDVFFQKQITKQGHDCFYHPEIAVSHLVPEQRLRKRWFIRRYYWQGVSDAAMQIIEEKPSLRRRLRFAASRAGALLRNPRNLTSLLLPANNPDQFTRKCFALITIGHLFGLLGAARKRDG